MKKRVSIESLYDGISGQHAIEIIQECMNNPLYSDTQLDMLQEEWGEDKYMWITALREETDDEREAREKQDADRAVWQDQWDRNMYQLLKEKYDGGKKSI